MPFCRHCGHQYEGAAKFCPECGQPQTVNATAEQEVTQPNYEPETPVWEGEAHDLTSRVSSGRLVSCRYRLTNTTLYFDEGLITNNSQQVPLWAVRDIDVNQGILQKARGVGDVLVHVQHSDYTGRNLVRLRDIEGPLDVRDLLNQYAQRERLAYNQRQQTRYYGRG